MMMHWLAGQDWPEGDEQHCTPSHPVYYTQGGYRWQYYRRRILCWYGLFRPPIAILPAGVVVVGWGGRDTALSNTVEMCARDGQEACDIIGEIQTFLWLIHSHWATLTLQLEHYWNNDLLMRVWNDENRSPVYWHEFIHTWSTHTFFAVQSHIL